MTGDEPIVVKTITGNVSISRELLDAYRNASDLSAFAAKSPQGVVAADAAAAEFKASRTAARRQYEVAMVQLLAVLEHDPVTRAVLELHRPVGFEHSWECGGCDLDGYDAEAPPWPCSTTRLVAEAHGIELPADFSFGEACR